MSKEIKGLKGKGIVVRGNEIDTDRIIPARFMKCITFQGLGAYAFNDERIDGRGNSRNHSFDNSKFIGHSVLVCNSNFGCGSSREHAPQALKDYGIHALLGESFAEIFAGNCLSLGMPAVILPSEDIQFLQKAVEETPDAEITIDIETLTVVFQGKTMQASMPDVNRGALLDGSWDSTAVLASAEKEIKATAEKLPYMA